MVKIENSLQCSTSIKQYLGNMSRLSAVDNPTEFLDHIKSLGLDCAVTVFNHYQNRPVRASGNCYNEALPLGWCERTDTLLVSTY